MTIDDDYENGVRRSSRDSGSLFINTDGGCSNNGYEGALTSYGLYFGDRSQFNECGVVPSMYRQTSLAAELYAAKIALERAIEVSDFLERHGCGFSRIVLLSDSSYLVRGITDYIGTWARNGWRTTRGPNVGNSQLWQRLYNLIGHFQHVGIVVNFEHVPRE